VRRLTDDEVIVLLKAEKRLRVANHLRIRQSAFAGHVSLMTAMLDAIDAVPSRRRMQLEPQLLERKASLLRRGIGLAGLSRFLEETAEELLMQILEPR
jgi:hypothetical protein